MERFVRLVVGGGVVLVAGLWVASLAATGTAGWTLGVVLALAGTGALLAGIGSELTV